LPNRAPATNAFEANGPCGAVLLWANKFGPDRPQTHEHEPHAVFRRCELWRVAVYAGGLDCARRLCLRLGSATESMSPLDRAWRRMRKIEARLEEDGSKPKRMRWATYERICEQLEAVEERGDALMLPGLERLLARCGTSIVSGD